MPQVLGAPSGGRKFTYLGYEFYSPWTDVKQERKFDTITVLNFDSGAMISILNPAMETEPLTVMKEAAVKRKANIKDVFGDQATRSNYDMRAYMLNLTPNDLRWFSSRQEMVRNSILLIIKNAESETLKDGILSFQTQRFRGFQEGVPGKSRIIVVELFDMNDRSLSMWIAGPKDHFTQDDVGHIIDSVRPVAAPGVK